MCHSRGTGLGWVSRSGGCIPLCVPGESHSAEHQLGKGWVVEPWGVDTWREPRLWTRLVTPSPPPAVCVLGPQYGCTGEALALLGSALESDAIVRSPVIRACNSSSGHLGRLCSRTVLSAVGCAGEKQECGGRGTERGWILLPFQLSDCLVLFQKR